jgi:hypothetical protein
VKDVDGNDLIVIAMIVCGTLVYIATMIWGK